MLDKMEIKDANTAPSRLSLMLWGNSGTGKTSLACTAPGKKLIILFDPDGNDSVRAVPDVSIADLSTEAPSLCASGLTNDPFNISKVIAPYDTIIIDSITKYSEKALTYAVGVTLKASLQNPTLQGYGLRNTIVLHTVSNILAITKRMGKHVIFITHEGAADKNEEGHVVSVPMLLGGQLPNLTGKEFSEIWLLEDLHGKRNIYIRPAKLRSPMKTRMFDTSTTSQSFTWKFDTSTWKGDTIEAWYNTWKNNGYTKLKLPV